jgi:hypothetical protein
MATTPQHLLEIFRRVRAGRHLGGGDVPLASLQSDVDMLLNLRLIEPAGDCLYRLTQLGALVFDGMKSAAGSAPS